MILCARVDSGDEGVESGGGRGAFQPHGLCCLGAPAAERVYYFPPAKSVIFLSGLGGSAPTEVTGRESSLRHEGAIAREGVAMGGVGGVDGVFHPGIFMQMDAICEKKMARNFVILITFSFLHPLRIFRFNGDQTLSRQTWRVVG